MKFADLLFNVHKVETPISQVESKYDAIDKLPLDGETLSDLKRKVVINTFEKLNKLNEENRKLKRDNEKTSKELIAKKGQYIKIKESNTSLNLKNFTLESEKQVLENDLKKVEEEYNKYYLSTIILAGSTIMFFFIALFT